MNQNKTGGFELNKIYLRDCIELFKKLPDNSIGLIFAGPPYNLQLNGELYRPHQTKTDAVNGNWNKIILALFPDKKPFKLLLDYFEKKSYSNIYKRLHLILKAKIRLVKFSRNYLSYAASLQRYN